MNEDTIIKRTSVIRLKLSDIDKKIIDTICSGSKNTINSGIYFCRHWYILYNLIIDYYINNIVKYIKFLTFNDKIKLIDYIVRKDKDLDEIENIKCCTSILDSMTDKEIMEINGIYNDSYIITTLISIYNLIHGIDDIKLTAYKNKKKKDENNDVVNDSNFNFHCFANQLKNIRNSLKYDKKDIVSFNIFIDDIIKMSNNKKSDKESEIKCNKIPPSYINSMIYYTYVQNKIKTDTYLASQVQQQTLIKLDAAYKSFFSLLKKKENKNKKNSLPKYLKKDEKYNAIYKSNSFKIIKIYKNKYVIRLSLGNELCNNCNKIINDNDIIFINKIKNKYIKLNELYENCIYNKPSDIKKYHKINIGDKEAPYIVYIKKDNKCIQTTKYLFINIGKFGKKFIENNKIIEVEIVPYYNGNHYELHIKYVKNILDKKQQNNINHENGYATIDLGKCNLITMNTSEIENPIIIDGVEITLMNKKINQKIDNHKSEIKKKYNLETDNYIQKLHIKRKNKIKDIFHKISKSIIEYLKNKNVHTLIIGYNKNWKNRVNMGRQKNREFYEIPYRRFVDMLFYKGTEMGIKVIEINESYTSKCDSLMFEEIGFHETYTGKRKHRGLFISGLGNVDKINKVKNFNIMGIEIKPQKSRRQIYINGDVNGQQNIMRKAIIKEGKEEDLMYYLVKLRQNIEKIKRPKKIKLNKINKLTEIMKKPYTEKRVW